MKRLCVECGEYCEHPVVEGDEYPGKRLTVPDVMPMVRDLYAGKRPCTRHTEIMGGHLHILLDDGNVTDHHATFCLEEAQKDGCANCVELAQKLVVMSQTQRLKLYRRKRDV